MRLLRPVLVSQLFFACSKHLVCENMSEAISSQCDMPVSMVVVLSRQLDSSVCGCNSSDYGTLGWIRVTWKEFMVSVYQGPIS